MRHTLLAGLTGLAVLAASALNPLPASADAALDRVFDTGHLSSVETGQRLIYAHSRILNGAPEVEDLEGGKVMLDLASGEKSGRVATVRIAEGKRSRALEAFPGDGGNPMLMVFLEEVLSTVSKSTGGSPFYIRNRIKDSFRGGSKTETVSLDTPVGKLKGVERVSYFPFAEETETDRLGIFVDLAISFYLTDEVPGSFAAFEATASGGAGGGGYEQRFDLQQIAKVSE